MNLQKLFAMQHRMLHSFLLFAIAICLSLSQFNSTGVLSAPTQPPGVETVKIGNRPVAEKVSTVMGGGFQLTPFEYYTPQGNGEKSQSTNCGPASVAMAIKYGSALDLQPTPQDVRDNYMRLTGSRSKKYTNLVDVRAALDWVGANHQDVTGAAGVWDAINRYHSVIVPTTMGEVPSGEDVKLAVNGRCADGKKIYQLGDKLYCYTNSRDVVTGRYYGYTGGHFILANGVFTDTDGTRFFYVFDPNVWTQGTREKYYYFGTPTLPKGKYRLWKWNDLDNALRNNGNIAVEVLHNPASPIPVLPALAAGFFDAMPQSVSTAESIELVEHVTYPDGSVLTPGQVVLKSWRIRNSGQSDLGLNYRLVQSEGAPVQLYGESEIGQVLGGDSLVVSAYVQAPTQLGNVTTKWQVIDSFGVPVQGTLNFNFIVAGEATNTYDNATFVSDASLPDGSVVSPGQALVKTWRVRNTGTSTWSSYKLIFLQGDQMGGASPVSIPTTSPNGQADISVSLQAPATTGNKVGYWQIVNRDGVHVSGGRLSVNVNVVSSTSNDHIAAFTASPPSPSSASTVMLYARVNWWAQFRAMRVKMDNQVIGETAAAEHTFSWDAGSASRGDHTLVLEVADQTDTSWSHPDRRVMMYTLQGTSAPANHAPNRPTPSSPYDWYVYYSGNTAQLCAQANGDPDGDAITGYYFDVYESAQLWNSGWTGSNCVTTGGLGPYDYKWRVKVRDSLGAESAWSDSLHFTLVNPSLSISELYFQPQDANSEVVKIRTCTTGQGGIGITMRVSVNDANDGSGNGSWHIIKEQGSPCFNDVDAPIWNTLEYGDGPHRVRSEAHGLQSGWNGATVREETYTLPHRRPASPELVAPVPASRNIRDAIYLNSRTVTFRWQPTIRTNSYTLHVGTSPSPQSDPNPIFRQPFGSNVFENTINFSQDYPTLYWQVTATNDAGSNNSGDQLFGIDRTAPSCTVQPLATVTYEPVFQVTWNGTDNLAGIRSFDIQYLDSGREIWSDWLLGVPVAKTYELFTGQPGHTYSFRCRATDNADNMGTYPASADTSIKVDPTARPQTPWWNNAYSGKRNIVILNNMSNAVLPIGYPVRLHFDSSTTPTAAEIYNVSQSNPKCNDLRIIYNDTIELDRVVQNCSSSAIDFWFRTQVSIVGGTSNNTAHQLYYGDTSAGAAPANANQVWYPYLESGTTNLYFFQEGSGSVTADSSGNSRNCTIGPAAQWGTGKFGNGIQINFQGRGGIRSLVCGNIAPLTAFTVEFWINTSSETDGRLIGALGGGDNGGAGNNWLIDYRGRIHLEVWPCPPCGSHGIESNFSLRDAQYRGKWNHIAVTFDGGNQVSFYINGNHDSTKTIPDQSGINSYAVPLEIGAAESMGHINAAFDGLRISNGVKTSFPYGAFAAITNEPTTAAGNPIAPPAFGSPDLAVVSLTAYPNHGGGVLVQAVVKNQGNQPTQNGFYTDLYADHLPTGAGDFTGSVRYWVAGSIAADQTAALTTVMPPTIGSSQVGVASVSAPSDVTSTIYAQVDSLGAISELNKSNNISAGIPICISGLDLYESDDSPGEASVITIGQAQLHNFSGPTDQDWMRFEALGGISYRLRTYNLAPKADTYLHVYAADGSTMLASNDDDSDSLASQIEWTAPATGTYYLLVQQWDPNAGGCGTSYDVEVVALPPIAIPDLAVNTVSDSVSLNWSHTGSGINRYEIWRSTKPYFSPDVADPETIELTQIAAPPVAVTLIFTDDHVMQNGEHYFYVIRKVNVADLFTDSPPVGLFVFYVQPGDQ